MKHLFVMIIMLFFVLRLIENKTLHKILNIIGLVLTIVGFVVFKYYDYTLIQQHLTLDGDI